MRKLILVVMVAFGVAALPFSAMAADAGKKKESPAAKVAKKAPAKNGLGAGATKK